MGHVTIWVHVTAEPIDPGGGEPPSNPEVSLTPAQYAIEVHPGAGKGGSIGVRVGSLVGPGGPSVAGLLWAVASAFGLALWWSDDRYTLAAGEFAERTLYVEAHEEAVGANVAVELYA